MMRFTLLATLLLAVAGCAQSEGFDRAGLNKQLSAGPTPATDKDIKRVMELTPQVRLPMTLGLYLRPRGYYGAQWSMKDLDAEWIETLRERGIVADVVPILSSTVEGHAIDDIRLAAARHHADMVLVVDYATDVDRYNNPLGMLYITIIGAWLAPGTHSDALVVMEGALWDVRNGYLYGTVRSEGEAKKLGPAFLLEDQKAVHDARRKALKDLQDQAQQRILGLAGKLS